MVVDFSSAGLLVDFFLPQSGHTQTMVGIEATITPVGTIEGAQKNATPSFAVRKNRSFCQDRLGTSTKHTLVFGFKEAFCTQAH